MKITLGNKYQLIHIGDKISNNIISLKNISNLALIIGLELGYLYKFPLHKSYPKIV